MVVLPQPSPFSCISCVSDSSPKPPLMFPPRVTWSCGSLREVEGGNGAATLSCLFAPPLQGKTRRSVRRNFEGWGTPKNFRLLPGVHPLPRHRGEGAVSFATFCSICCFDIQVLDSLMVLVRIVLVHSLTWSLGSRVSKRQLLDRGFIRGFVKNHMPNGLQ